MTNSNSFSSSKLKLKHKKQFVVARGGATVVSPLVEADEKPSHSVINIPISPQPNLYPVQIMHTPSPSPSNPFNNLNYNNLPFHVVNQVDIRPDENLFHNEYDVSRILNEANLHLTQGNFQRSLDLYADALARVDSSQETKVLSHIVNNLNKVHNDLANKLQTRLGGIKPGLADKIRNLMFKIGNPVAPNNNLNVFNNEHSLENELAPLSNSNGNINNINKNIDTNTIGDSLVSKPPPVPNRDTYNNKNIDTNTIGDSLVSELPPDDKGPHPNPLKQSAEDEEVISLEPKKKILRLGNKNGTNRNTDASVNKNKNINNSSSVHKNDKTMLAGLIDWAKQNHIQLKKLKVNSNSKVTGESNIKVGERVHKNELILSIPKDYLISKENPELIDLCNQIKKIKFFKKNYDKICMTVFLVRSQNTKFKSFIDFIHDNTIFSSFPFFFTKKEAKMIEGSYFSSLVQGREEAMNFEYKILKEDKILADSITQQAYYEARVNVMSKNFSLEDSKGHNISFLAPFTDLLNHNSVKANARLDLTSEGLEIRAISGIKKNEPVFTTYGKFSNFHYLLYYGFVEQHNPVSVSINLELKIKNGGNSKNNQVVNLCPDMKLNSTLKNFRKIVDQFAGKKNSSHEEPHEVVSEIEALRLLKVGLKKQISKYHTTLVQDKEHIASSPKSRNVVNILTVLIEEKRIIVRYYNAALVFYKMLKRINEESHINMTSNNNHENKLEMMTLTKKVSDMIQKKKYMREYYELIIKVFKLNIQFNKEEKSEEIDLDLSDLQSESEEEYEREMNFDNFENFENFENMASNEYNYEGNDYSYGSQINTYPHNDHSNRSLESQYDSEHRTEIDSHFMQNNH